MITTLKGGEGSASRPGRSLPPGKTRYLLYRRLGGPQSRSGQMRKISPPPGFDLRTVQPLASRYTNYTTWPTYRQVIFIKGCNMKIVLVYNRLVRGESYKILEIKLYKNKSRHRRINNLSAATCFVFLSQLQSKYTIVVWIVYYHLWHCKSLAIIWL
jgi:hypothetical protein